MRILTALALALVAAGAFAQTPASIPPPADVAAPPADATKTASGLATKVLQPGTGKEHPSKEDLVKIHYTGWTTDGKMFDSSVARNQPSTFPVSRVIPGFSEGLQLMVAGEKRRLWIPEALAYKGQAGRPAGMLVFDIELLDMPNRAPSDVKAAPADAKKTASGLAYKVLKPGTNARRPKSTNRVTVHYTGWTTDGKMFDSSVVRGEPSTFALDQVIPGWTEGVQLMAEGEKTRFWIPEKLAYGGKSAPYGMLVFDIELIKIE
jgi:peptidylprolyl isomerase